MAPAAVGCAGLLIGCADLVVPGQRIPRISSSDDGRQSGLQQGHDFLRRAKPAGEHHYPVDDVSRFSVYH